MQFKIILLSLLFISSSVLASFSPRIFWQSNDGLEINTETETANLNVNSTTHKPLLAEPFACSVAKKGSSYFSDTDSAIYTCDGVSWLKSVGGIPSWESAKLYKVGDVVIYTDNNVYKCLTENSDVAFTESSWQAVGGKYQALEASQSSGIIKGCDLNVSSIGTTQINLDACEVRFVDNYTDPSKPDVTVLKLNAQVVALPNLATQEITVLTIDKTGAIQSIEKEIPSSVEMRDKVLLGAAIHPSLTQVDAVNNETFGAPIDVALALSDYREVKGVENFQGNIFSSNATNGLKLDKTQGKVFGFGINYKTNRKDPNFKTVASCVDCLWTNTFQDGAGGWKSTTPTDLLTPTLYDDGTGTLGTLLPNKYSIVRLYQTGDFLVAQYGQKVFNSISDAKEALSDIDHVENPALRGTAQLAWLIVGSSDTTLAKEQIIAVRAGAGTGGTASIPTDLVATNETSFVEDVVVVWDSVSQKIKSTAVSIYNDLVRGRFVGAGSNSDVWAGQTGLVDIDDVKTTGVTYASVQDKISFNPAATPDQILYTKPVVCENKTEQNLVRFKHKYDFDPTEATTEVFTAHLFKISSGVYTVVDSLALNRSATPAKNVIAFTCDPLVDSYALGFENTGTTAVANSIEITDIEWTSDLTKRVDVNGIINQSGMDRAGVTFTYSGTTCPEGSMLADGRTLNTSDFPDLAKARGATGLTFDIPTYTPAPQLGCIWYSNYAISTVMQDGTVLASPDYVQKTVNDNVFAQEPTATKTLGVDVTTSRELTELELPTEIGKEYTARLMHSVQWTASATMASVIELRESDGITVIGRSHLGGHHAINNINRINSIDKTFVAQSERIRVFLSTNVTARVLGETELQLTKAPTAGVLINASNVKNVRLASFDKCTVNGVCPQSIDSLNEIDGIVVTRTDVGQYTLVHAQGYSVTPSYEVIIDDDGGSISKAEVHTTTTTSAGIYINAINLDAMRDKPFTIRITAKKPDYQQTDAQIFAKHAVVGEQSSFANEGPVVTYSGKHKAPIIHSTGGDLYSYNSSTGIYTVLKDNVSVTISGNGYHDGALGDTLAVVIVDGVTYSQNTTNTHWAQSSITKTLNTGDTFFAESTVGITHSRTSVSAKLITSGLISTTTDAVHLHSAKIETPASSSAPCKKGTVYADSAFIYVCVLDNTWTRSSASSW